jgi:rhodanese-related sulfurtransferase
MNKKQLLNTAYWILIAAMGLYFAYSKGWILTDFKSISPKEAYELMKSDEKITVLDVRTPDEFAQEHIDGATLIPLQTLEGNLGLISDAKNQKLIVYCHSGNRSVAASRILAKSGFTPLNVKGGITEWKAEGLPVVQ